MLLLFQAHLAVNHVSHAEHISVLTPALVASSAARGRRARVVLVGSTAAWWAPHSELERCLEAHGAGAEATRALAEAQRRGLPWAPYSVAKVSASLFMISARAREHTVSRCCRVSVFTAELYLFTLSTHIYPRHFAEGSGALRSGARQAAGGRRHGCGGSPGRGGDGPAAAHGLAGTGAAGNAGGSRPHAREVCVFCTVAHVFIALSSATTAHVFVCC